MAPKNWSAAQLAAASKGCKAAAAKHRRTPAAAAEEPVLESNGEVQAGHGGMLLDEPTDGSVGPRIDRLLTTAQPLDVAVHSELDFAARGGGTERGPRADRMALGMARVSACTCTWAAIILNLTVSCFYFVACFYFGTREKRRRVDGCSCTQKSDRNSYMCKIRYRESTVWYCYCVLLQRMTAPPPRPTRGARNKSSQIICVA